MILDMLKTRLLHTRREIVAGVSASMGLLGRIPLVRAFTPSCTPDTDDATWTLLLSDEFVLRAQGIRRYLVHPRKLPEPIILPDENCIHNPYVFGTLIYDPTACRFRLWYQTYTAGAHHKQLYSTLTAPTDSNGERLTDP